MTGSESSREVRLRALVDVVRTISASLAHEEILGQICGHASRLLEAESAVLTEARERCVVTDGPCLRVVATSPEAAISFDEILTIEGSLNGRALAERRILIVNDVMADSRADHALARKLDARKVVIAPLFHGETALGTIFALNPANQRDFDETDGEILEALAAQAAIALHNARLFESEQEQLAELTRLRAAQDENLQRLRALVRAGMALNSSSSLEAVLQTLVDSARQVIKARYAALGVLDRSGDALSRFLQSGLDAAAVERIGDWPTGGGTLGIMLREAKTIRLRDLTEHPSFAGFPEGHPRMTSLLGVPVRIADQVFGNLYLTDKVGADEFSIEDQELAELLAAQAAVAIENARLAEQRSQFMAIVNHEIKNAAAGVVGWTDRLHKLTGEAEGRVREGARYAYEGAKQLHRLVVDLLDLSRIETRQLELEIQKADLPALIREVVATLRPTAERQEIELRTSGLDQRTILQTDATRVRQILLNLLTNAIKFSRKGDSVELKLNSREGDCLISVRDTGPGVDPEISESVFEAYQIGGDRSRSGGAGLGLAISRELARLLGGELSHVESSTPGACFQLRLPSQPPGDQGPAEEQRPSGATET